MQEHDGPVFLAFDGRLARIRLNRAAKRNAITRDMWRAIPGLVAQAEHAHAIVIESVSADCFSAGADIAELHANFADPAQARASAAEMQAALDAVAAAGPPTLALVRGVCVGGGCSLALACDLRLASDTARFAITPAKLGLVYNHPQTASLVRRIGAARAREMLFSACTVAAAEAHAMGLVEVLWPEERFAAESEAYLARLLAASPASLRATKRIVAAIESGAAAETQETRALFLDAFESPDAQEGYRAFLEKRPPAFPSAASSTPASASSAASPPR